MINFLKPPESRPPAVRNVAALAVSQLGSKAQRERRRRILGASVAIASRGGYAAVQMRAVADRADVAVGTPYRYFQSKLRLDSMLAGAMADGEPTEGQYHIA